MTDPDDDNPLSRWSRRKLALREKAPGGLDADTPSLPSGPAAAEADAAAAAAREAELKANREAAEAVDLEKLDKDSDLSVFLKDGVPELLRRRAMAMLWRTNPVFANVDGLVDYDDDFASPGLVMKTLKSAWQVGRGYAKEEDGEKPGSEAAPDIAEPAEGDAGVAYERATGGDTGDATAEDNGEREPPPSGDHPPELAGQPLQDDEGAEEPEPAPRVSLRRRLMLDDTGETPSKTR